MRMFSLRTPVIGRQRGFSVVEIMIAMVASLIVVGSVLAFTVSTVQSNTENVQATRLSQDLRAVMGLVTRELRRAGYDEGSLDGIGRGTAYVSPFSTMQIVANSALGCVTFAYDKEGGTAGSIDADRGELRAYRRAVINGVGVIQMRTGANTSCQSAGGWNNLTDPQSSDVTAFTLNLPLSAVVGGSPLSDIGGDVPLRIRNVDIVLSGRVVGRPEIVRTMDSRVRVRADCIRTNLDDCNAVPAP
ncbi:MAG: hypothetical protein H7A20_02675 [Rhodanobacteraceae bacterium]|nr:hypothetical protein [Rhodanobacteraceae bacterium]